MVADGPAEEQAARVVDRLADLLAARDFADAGAAGAVSEDRDVAREERPVRTAQVQQQAVAPGDGDDSKLGDCRDGHGCSQSCHCPSRPARSIAPIAFSGTVDPRVIDATMADPFQRCIEADYFGASRSRRQQRAGSM
jgi:hypothetical protein